MADMIADAWDFWGVEQDYNYDEIEKLAKKKLWKTKDEKIISIKKIEYSHLYNIVRMLKSDKYKDSILTELYLEMLECRLKKLEPKFGFLNAL